MISETVYGKQSSVVITGASSGIGAALAEYVASYGARVALVARREDRLHDVALRVRAAGGEPLVVCCDVTDEAAVKGAYNTIVHQQGAVTVAFLNAGIADLERPFCFQGDMARRVFNVNVLGVAYWLERLLPEMRQRGSGAIVGISSLAALRGLPMSATYCASKAALSTLLEGLSVEYAKSGVQICIVEPGFIRSEMTARNKFPMPFLMDAAAAAEIICESVAEGKTVVRFPWQLALAMKVVRYVPSVFYQRIGSAFMNRLTQKSRDPHPSG